MHHITLGSNGIGNLTGKRCVASGFRGLDVFSQNLLLGIFQEMLQAFHTAGLRTAQIDM